jgi:hypothetical protein
MNLKTMMLLSAAVAMLVVAAGCKDSKLEKALESDANGYVCQQCSAKFYTAREVFAGHCPQCKKPDIEQAIGFSCPADKHVTVAARSRGARRCEKCGGPTSGISIPGEAELKAWGATKKTAAEVGG